MRSGVKAGAEEVMARLTLPARCGREGVKSFVLNVREQSVDRVSSGRWTGEAAELGRDTLTGPGTSGGPR